VVPGESASARICSLISSFHRRLRSEPANSLMWAHVVLLYALISAQPRQLSHQGQGGSRPRDTASEQDRPHLARRRFWWRRWPQRMIDGRQCCLPFSPTPSSPPGHDQRGGAPRVARSCQLPTPTQYVPTGYEKAPRKLRRTLRIHITGPNRLVFLPPYNPDLNSTDPEALCQMLQRRRATAIFRTCRLQSTLTDHAPAEF
jgi:hypothetical protein